MVPGLSAPLPSILAVGSYDPLGQGRTSRLLALDVLPVEAYSILGPESRTTLTHFSRLARDVAAEFVLLFARTVAATSANLGASALAPRPIAPGFFAPWLQHLRAKRP